MSKATKLLEAYKDSRLVMDDLKVSVHLDTDGNPYVFFDKKPDYSTLRHDFVSIYFKDIPAIVAYLKEWVLDDDAPAHVLSDYERKA